MLFSPNFEYVLIYFLKLIIVLVELITNNRITSDILSRYTSYIYIHVFDKGRNSHLTDLINSVSELLEQKENKKIKRDFREDEDK